MDDVAVESAVEDVIRQFADPLALFRELIQNAIDAGSGEVDVSLEYDEARGLGVIAVADWGEGMTREIIESQLVRLFSSAKDADLTKIGKFGIGFISVLAVEPKLVSVETGRDGEYWRLLLHPDRRYELFSLENPVEGTTVRLFVEQTREEFDDFRRRAAERVSHWCRFVDVPVFFDGEDVRENFELDGIVVARFEEEGTRVVTALREERTCGGAYFNAGLALQETKSRWPHVEFMLDSRYLEHTLARDRILEDKNFHEALERLDETVRTTLRAEVERALAEWPTNPDRAWDWSQLCGVLPGPWGEGIIAQVQFPTVGGPTVKLAEAGEARDRNRLMMTRGRAHFAAMMPDEYVLLDMRPDGAPARLLSIGIERDVPVLEDVWVHVPTAAPRDDAERTLLAELEKNLRALGSTPRHVGFGEFDYPYSQLEERIFIAVEDRSRPTHRADVRPFDPFETTTEVLVNVGHPLVVDAIEVARTEPEWAGYTLAKVAALEREAIEHGRFGQELDAHLALESLKRRQQRVAGMR